jgi:hypothetical protein
MSSAAQSAADVTGASAVFASLAKTAGCSA